jgi:two-component system KDP operon response regulator KdpE
VSEDAAVPGRLVLVIEDELPIRRFLRAAFESAGFEFEEAATARDGLASASSRAPDLIVLDLGLPDLDGIEVTQRLREWFAAPILVLSARGQERDKIRALDAGADDYVTKPFSVGELMARVRVALRHRSRADGAEGGEVVEVGPLRIDHGRHAVTLEGRPVKLTPIEFRLLFALACCAKPGDRRTRTSTTTCASTWPSFGTSSRRCPRARDCCSPSRASVTACARSETVRASRGQRPAPTE